MSLYPVEMDKYAVQSRVEGNPVFASWIRHVMVNCNRIIVKLNSKYYIKTHKFGFNIPKSVQKAKEFYKENGNTLLWDAVFNKMKNIRPDFEVW